MNKIQFIKKVFTILPKSDHKMTANLSEFQKSIMTISDVDYLLSKQFFLIALEGPVFVALEKTNENLSCQSVMSIMYY